MQRGRKNNGFLHRFTQILECREFVNADEIAKGLSPFNPDSVAIEAGKLMLKRIEQRTSFAIETTLATRSYASLVNRAHRLGYRVVLLFFGYPLLKWQLNV